MTLNIASLNARGLRDPSKCSRLFGELSNHSRELENDYVVFSAFGSHCSAGVFQLVGRRLNADVNLDFAGDGGRMVVADVAIKSFEFQEVAVYAPNCIGERHSFF